MQVCKMMFDMTGVTRQYVDMEVDYDGVEYTGPDTLLEYTVRTVSTLFGFASRLHNRGKHEFKNKVCILIIYQNFVIQFHLQLEIQGRGHDAEEHG